jgi:hypothetical protein
MNQSENSTDWLNISGLARSRGVDKSGVSRRVARFEAQGLLQSRVGPNRTKLINAVEFDRLAAGAVDGGAPPPSLASHPILLREQARRAAAVAELTEMTLAQRRGTLLESADVFAALATCTQAIDEALEQSLARAAEENPTVPRTVWSAARRDVMNELARAMSLIAAPGRVDSETRVEEAAEA